MEEKNTNLTNSELEILKKKGVKLKEIEKAKNDGWKGLSQDEINYDTEMIYNKLIDGIKNSDPRDKETQVMIQLINNIKKQKDDQIKFLMQHKLKEKEIMYKYDAEDSEKKKQIVLDE